MVPIDDGGRWDEAARNFAKAILDLVSNQVNTPPEPNPDGTDDQDLSMWSKLIDDAIVAPGEFADSNTNAHGQNRDLSAHKQVSAESTGTGEMEIVGLERVEPESVQAETEQKGNADNGRILGEDDVHNGETHESQETRPTEPGDGVAIEMDDDRTVDVATEAEIIPQSVTEPVQSYGNPVRTRAPRARSAGMISGCNDQNVKSAERQSRSVTANIASTVKPSPSSGDRSIYAITKLLQRNTATDAVNSMVRRYYLVQLAKQVDARSESTAFVHFASTSRPRTRKERASDVYSDLMKEAFPSIIRPQQEQVREKSEWSKLHSELKTNVFEGRRWLQLVEDHGYGIVALIPAIWEPSFRISKHM